MTTKKHDSKKHHKSAPEHTETELEVTAASVDLSHETAGDGLPLEIEARTEEARFIQESPGAAQETLSSELPPVGAVEVNKEVPVADHKKFHLDFYGSEALRARAPKAFELAEAVADDWVNDGRFEKLPVDHPLAQFAAQLSLRKAKDLEKRIEKKLEETGVIALAKSMIVAARARLQQ